MGIRIHFVILLIFACIICHINAQSFLDTFMQKLQKNQEIIKKKNNNDDNVKEDYDYEYDEDDDKVEVKPPTPQSKTSGRLKPTKDPEKNAKGSDASTPKKHGGPKNDETANPRHPNDKGVGFRVADDSDGPETLKVLTVKKFMFQAQPVTPVSKKTSETRKIYYYS